jgi:hypothetical protein
METAAGRAVNANGLVWEIEPRTKVSDGWGSLNRHRHRSVYYRYGAWSGAEGLVRRPVAPQLDAVRLEQQAFELIQALRRRLGQLPFRLVDRRELWLLDPQDRKPLALLAAMRPSDSLTVPAPKSWQAGPAGKGLPSQRRYPAADELAMLVKQRAGFNVQRQWILRQDDGSGLLETDGSRLAREALPPFLLSEQWPTPDQVELARAYITWTAPALLTLQQLSSSERERLESSLYVQAESIEHHWRLYPETVDAKHLRAARVQNRLHRANSTDSVAY